MFYRLAVTLDGDNLSDVCCKFLDKFHFTITVATSQGQARVDGTDVYISFSHLDQRCNEDFSGVVTESSQYKQIFAFIRCRKLYTENEINEPVYSLY